MRAQNVSDDVIWLDTTKQTDDKSLQNTGKFMLTSTEWEHYITILWEHIR